MSCVEVDGAGWRWVHGLVIPVFVFMAFSLDLLRQIFQLILG